MDREKTPENVRTTSFSGADVWERSYTNQGRLWGGIPFPVESLPEGSRVIELGCGSGKLLSLLAQNAYDCIALDFSRKACQLAHASVNNPAVCILTADVRMLPFRTGCIDAVVAHHVTGHLIAANRAALFSEAARVLRGDGRFIFCDFSKEDFRAGQGIEVEEGTYLRGNGIITHYFTEEEIRSLPKSFHARNIETIRRSMVVRGRSYARAELVASFTRT